MLKTKSQLLRLLYIHEQLILSNTVNAYCISKKYECSSRTIKRDIDFMRNDLDLPVIYDKKRKSFYYTKRIYGNYWKVETMKKFL
jgi:predicted DNA-binding transcriptional regulator YafY